MMKKLFALLLAVMMVVALVPAVIASAEEVDFSVPTDGKTAEQIAASYGKDLTTGTRAQALVHGVNDCFDVYNGTTLVGTYKTFTSAWAAMKPGYTLKLKGNVHATDWAAMLTENSDAAKGATVHDKFTDAAGVGTYTIDGQGYVFDIEVKTAKTSSYFQFALCFSPTANGVSILDINNIAILSDSGVVAFAGGAKENPINLNNVKLYGGNGYYKVDPAYYGDAFVYPTNFVNGWNKTNLTSNQYIMTAAMYIQDARNRVVMDGEDSVIYGRNSAIRGKNCYFTLNDGLVKTEGTMYGGKNSDSAAIFVVQWSNSNITINGGRVVNTQADTAACGIRVQQGQTVNVNGGEFYTTGSAVHIRQTQKDKTITVTVTGGLFVALPNDNVNLTQHNGFFTSNATSTNGRIKVNFNIRGGVFVNQRKQCKALAAVTDKNSTFSYINITGGLWLSKVDSTFALADFVTHAKNGVLKELTLDGGKTVMYQGEEYYVCEAPKATANELAPVMYDGASMGLDPTTNCIHFTAQVKKTAGATYGMLIVPTDYALKAFADNGTLTKEALLAAAADTSKVLDIAATVEKDNGDSYDIYCDVKSTDNDIRGMSLTAIAYTVDGANTYYSAVDLAKNSRSISYVARMALGDVKAEKDDEYQYESIYNEQLGVTLYSQYTAAEQNLIKGTLSMIDEGAVRALIDIKFVQTKVGE